MKLFVTGGVGFIGSNFILYILKKYSDFEIVNYDKLTYAGNPENLKAVEQDSRYKFVHGDIADAAKVDQVLAQEKPYAIVSFAAESHVDRSIMDPMAFLTTNVIGTQVLLAATKTHNIAKMIQISTDEVFGVNETGEFDENSSLRPRNPYSASKAACELLCQSHFITYQTPVIITHGANAFGPYQYPEKFMPLAITNILEGKKIPVYGDGMQVREWVYVEDFVSAVDAVLHNGKLGEAYNIGTGHRQPNLQTAKDILHYLGKDESHLEFVPDRRGHDRRYAVNAEKIKIELGWKPQYDFQEALANTVKWYKDNQAWWQKIKSGAYLEYYKKQYVTRQV